jgi:hypothetical protein
MHAGYAVAVAEARNWGYSPARQKSARGECTARATLRLLQNFWADVMSTMGSRMTPPRNGEEKRYRLGSYGAGTLWCLSNRSSLSILFNDTPIATRGRARRPESRCWTSLDPTWKVTPLEGSEIWVQHNDGEGVFLSLVGGMR